MKTQTTLRLDQKGAKSLSTKYGRKLIAVRFHYDETTKCRIKTVELIEEVVPWKRRQGTSPLKLVTVQLGPVTASLRRKIISLGGRPSADGNGWRLRYGAVLKLGLMDSE